MLVYWAGQVCRVRYAAILLESHCMVLKLAFIIVLK